ncbi:MAG: hypothetical protein NDJ94_14715 [Vicinamibacteria bacterium]|nr:hypothetical protein [Vicinamibacteria bacterium]
MRGSLIRSAALLAVVAAGSAEAAIRRDPNGVNVDASGATTVFITFGGLQNQVAAEAFWCGELKSAAPDIGQKCDESTLFGSLPLRYDRSSRQGSVFTDVMSIPASVARRAYQAAQSGRTSSFFYVRRFVSTAGGPDEYVFVTCRMAGGGARVPFSLLDVRLAFDGEPPVLALAPGATPPRFSAQLSYTGTGRLRGRWEVVVPGEEPPTPEDLLTEATLPPSERGRQRRYAPLERFDVFLAPTGRFTLPGPDVARLPRQIEGLYLILLRVEAADDKEADSNLALAGAGTGVVHSGAVAGFPMPVLRYYVGGVDVVPAGDHLAAMLPADGAELDPARPVEFSWVEPRGIAALRLSLIDAAGQEIHAAVVLPGVGLHRAPAWLAERVATAPAQWSVAALDSEGEVVERTPARRFSFRPR